MFVHAKLCPFKFFSRRSKKSQKNAKKKKKRKKEREIEKESNEERPKRGRMSEGSKTHIWKCTLFVGNAKTRGAVKPKRCDGNHRIKEEHTPQRCSGLTIGYNYFYTGMFVKDYKN